jgi:hypothetical protein
MKRTLLVIDADKDENLSSVMTKKHKLDDFICFPVDCLLPIFEYCHALTVLYSLPCVCTTWRVIILGNEENIWKRLCHSEFPMLEEIMSNETGIYWKQFFLDKVDIQKYDDYEDVYLAVVTREEELNDNFADYEKRRRICNELYSDATRMIVENSNNPTKLDQYEIKKQDLLLLWVSSVYVTAV